MTINFAALGVVGCESLDKVQVQPPAPSAEQPDHTALLRQALEALEERYIGALRDNALDALRAALGEKRC
jgi:hypothetical protein